MQQSDMQDLLHSAPKGLPIQKMMETMTQEIQTNNLKEVVNKLIPHSTGKDIQQACQSIYPLHDVFPH
jgi:ribosomal protein S3AE